MNNQYTVRAIDIGYGNTKFVTEAHAHGVECGVFPSCAPAESRSAMGDESGLMSRSNDIVTVGGMRYEVGSDTHLFEEPRILHEDYTQTSEYLALYKAALGKMGVSQIDVLVTGLPVAHLERRKGSVQEQFRGSHVTGDGSTVFVRQVQVIAQPMGGLLDHCIDRGGAWQVDRSMKHLLVDPGYYTLDWVIAEGLKEVPKRSGSYATGVSHVLAQVAAEIGKATNHPFDDLNKLDDGIRAGRMRVRGTTLELGTYKPSIKTVWGPALHALKNSVGDGRAFDEIFVVGGGAHLLERHLQELFPDHPLKVSRDPVYANVRGFQYLGESMVRRAA
jgi:plasmid segregation protein ParM